MSTATRTAPNIDDRDAIDDAIWATEELRRAEAQLARRRQSRCGPSDTDRQAWRFVVERHDAGEVTTPGDIAEHLGVATASVTKLLVRMQEGSMLECRPHPEDRRKKLVLPVDRNNDPDLVDPLTTQIRNIATRLRATDARAVASFLQQVIDAVNDDCR